MSRSAFLSAGGDVLLADFCLNLWNKHWRDEIDTMYVGYNNNAQVPLAVAYEFLRKWEKDPKVRIIYTPHGVGNGVPITQMLLNSKEDALLLLEDDGFLFTPYVVSEWFTLIEDRQADMVGSPRYGIGEIMEAVKTKYNLDYSGIGDRGGTWWPNFFVCKREDLLKTDLDFGSKKYPKGEYFKELDHTMTEDCYTDTFAWTSIQLRYMGLRDYSIPQNHASPFDFTFKDTREGMFHDGFPKYIHGGSLSSGWNGYLSGKLPSLATDMERADIETRVAFWKIACDSTPAGEYVDFRIEYDKAILKLILDGQLNNENIVAKYNLYKQIIQV